MPFLNDQNGSYYYFTKLAYDMINMALRMGGCQDSGVGKQTGDLRLAPERPQPPLSRKTVSNTPSASEGPVAV